MMTPAVRKLIIRRLLAQRMTHVVTPASLADDVAKEKGVCIGASAVRKRLRFKGYKWLPRRQKRKYSKEQRKNM